MKTSSEFGIVRSIEKDLQGDNSIEVFLADLVDRTHTTLVEFLEDLVLALDGLQLWNRHRFADSNPVGERSAVSGSTRIRRGRGPGVIPAIDLDRSGGGR